MKGLVITNKGIESISALEVKELINAKSEIKETAVIFDFEKYEDLFTLCYKAQSLTKVLFLFDFFEFTDREALIEHLKIKKIDFSEWLDKKKKFKVVCKRIGEHDFSSADIENEVGKLIDFDVNLENPDVIFYAYIFNNNFYFGIDFAGLDLSKREYRIFTMPSSLKATIAYSLVRIAGFKGILLDPFCCSGEIAIEAAIFASGFPVNYYNKSKFAFLKLKPFAKFNFDKFFKEKKIKKQKIYCFDNQQRNVKSAEKNAKIAGIHKLLNFSRVDIGFLELKFKKNVDRIITQLPALSKYSDRKQIEKIYDEFFYQAEYILSKDGTITIISDKTDEIKKKAEKYKFRVLSERSVFSGQKEYKVIVLK